MASAELSVLEFEGVVTQELQQHFFVSQTECVGILT